MEENFALNQLKSGDSGFQYDKRRKFDYEEEDLEEYSGNEDDDDIDSDEYDTKTAKTGKVTSSKNSLEIATPCNFYQFLDLSTYI